MPDVENDPPTWCLACKVGSDGETYLAFIRRHSGCTLPPEERST